MSVGGRKGGGVFDNLNMFVGVGGRKGGVLFDKHVCWGGGGEKGEWCLGSSGEDMTTYHKYIKLDLWGILAPCMYINFITAYSMTITPTQDYLL